MKRKGNKKKKKKEQKIKENKQHLKSKSDTHSEPEHKSITMPFYVFGFGLTILLVISLALACPVIGNLQMYWIITIFFLIFLIFLGILNINLRKQQLTPEKIELKNKSMIYNCSLVFLSLILFMTLVSDSVDGFEFMNLLGTFFKVGSQENYVTITAILLMLAILKVLKEQIGVVKNWNVIIQEEKKAFENKNKTSYRILKVQGAKNMQAIADIEKEYVDILLENNQETKNEKLAELMNQLEKDYGTFKIAINNAELDTTKVNNQAMRLYSKISASREFEKTIDK